jgi:phytoene dehydrogenase-like protein
MENKRAAGLVIDGEKYAFDVIVCNMDIVPAYQKLMPEIQVPKKIITQERSSSALIFYWGIGRAFPALGLHNVLFSENYAEEFGHIFKKKTIYHDPTVYINITSKDIKTDAPNGCENWFVMINVPANTNGYFNEEVKQAARQSIINKINTLLKTDIEPLITCEKVLDPVSIENNTGSLYGSLYGTSSNNRMAAFNRHANFTTKVKDLYFCGGSVHPGGGIPLCLNSAKIVSDLIA